MVVFGVYFSGDLRRNEKVRQPLGRRPVWATLPVVHTDRLGLSQNRFEVLHMDARGNSYQGGINAFL